MISLGRTASPRSNRHARLRAMQDLCVRDFRQKYSHGKDVNEVNVRRACQSRSINVSYNFGNVTSDSVLPERQETMAEHA